MAEDTTTGLLLEVADVEAQGATPVAPTRAAMLGCFIALTAIAASERVVLKKTLDSLPDYGVFLNQITVFLFILLFAGIVWYKQRYTTTITPAMRRFPKYKFALISVCDTLGGILLLISGSFVDGKLMTLLVQGVVPATIIGSILILRRKFHMWNYVGATVVLLGIVCNTIPAFTSHEGGLIKNVWYVIPLFLSNVFVALSSIMQEVVLKGQDMDLYYYQLWIAIFQFTLSTLLSPLSFMLQMRHARVSELPGNFFDGLLCWLPGTDPTHASPEVHAACGDAFASLLIYYVLVILLNITIAVTIKLGSAAAMNVAMTTAVPVQYTAFSIKIPFLVEKTTRLSFWNIIGLVVTVGGLVAYNAAPEAGGEQEDGAGLRSPLMMASPVAIRSPMLSPRQKTEARALDVLAADRESRSRLRRAAHEAPY